MDTIKESYNNRFAWRKERQIFNLEELALIPESGGAEPLEAFPNLSLSKDLDDPKNALRWSIIYLIAEATECFVFGTFQSCILTCGSVVERALKLEYLSVHNSLPKGNWTLGRCIHQLDWKNTRVSETVIQLAASMLEPRNNRAHALLESSDPLLSIMGGPNRGIEIIPVGHMVEPYRGDAKNTIETTYKILSNLYG